MKITHHIRVFVLTIAGLCCAASSSVQAATDPEKVVMAVMVRKFSEFVIWPESNSPMINKRIKVCAFSDSSIAQMSKVFAKTSPGDSVSYELQVISAYNESLGCHIVFLSHIDQSLLSRIRNHPVLTISDEPGFSEAGGMIGFQLIDGKVRFNINNGSFGVKEHQLRVDARLLEIANKVLE